MAKDNIVRAGGNGRRSNYVVAGGLVYVSGIATVALEADARGQTEDVLAQIDRLLANAGTSKARLVSATVFLRSMEDYPAFNGAWDIWVDDGDEPALTVVEAKSALSEYRVTISVIATL